MTEKELLSSIHKGMHKANNDLTLWTGGSFITDMAAESFAVTNIMQKIMGHPNKPAFLDPEAHISALKQCSGRAHKGRTCPITGGGQRVDIATYNRKGQLKFVVEVKSAYQWQDKYLDDLKRLIKLQKEFSKQHAETAMQAGVFTVAIHSYSKKGYDEAEENLFEKAHKWETRISDYLDKFKNIKFKFNRSEEKFCKWESSDGSEVHLLTSLCVVVKLTQNTIKK